MILISSPDSVVTVLPPAFVSKGTENISYIVDSVVKYNLNPYKANRYII